MVKIPRVSWTERKSNKNNFTGNETKHFFENPEKNVKNATFRIRDEDTSIPGE